MKRLGGLAGEKRGAERGSTGLEGPKGTKPKWEIPVLKTVAQSGEGLSEVLAAIAGHREFLVASGVLEERRKARASGRVKDVVEREFRKVAWTDPWVRATLEGGVSGILSGADTPYSLGARILESLLKKS